MNQPNPAPNRPMNPTSPWARLCRACTGATRRGTAGPNQGIRIRRANIGSTTLACMESPRERHRSGPIQAGTGLNDTQLARLAVSTALDGIDALERLGLEPTQKLRARADGDPEQVEAYVEHHKRLQAKTTAA